MSPSSVEGGKKEEKNRIPAGYSPRRKEEKRKRGEDGRKGKGHEPFISVSLSRKRGEKRDPPITTHASCLLCGKKRKKGDWNTKEKKKNKHRLAVLCPKKGERGKSFC